MNDMHPNADSLAVLASPLSGMASPQKKRLAAGLKVEKSYRLCRRNRRGAALVEFAVVSPVMFLMVFGMIEYGRMVMVQQVLVNSAREGARVGVLDGSTLANVQTAVNNYLTAAFINGATIGVTPNPPSSAGFGQPVTVTVSVPFNQVSWLATPIFLKGRSLSASSTMRRESAQ
jgi:Flp pilus assembly protein TadG